MICARVFSPLPLSVSMTDPGRSSLAWIEAEEGRRRRRRRGEKEKKKRLSFFFLSAFSQLLFPISSSTLLPLTLRFVDARARWMKL